MSHGVGRLRSARNGVRAMAAAALAISVLVSAGCGSESHAAEEQTVDLTKLDTGSFVTKSQPLVPNDPAAMARNMEALRLGNAMPLPLEIDSTLSRGGGGALHPFTSVNSFQGSPAFGWLNITDFTANTAGFVAGFATNAGSDPDFTLSHTLTSAAMIFDTDDAASRAAVALARSGFVTKEAVEPAQSTQYPSAQILWIPKYQVLASWYASGKFVIVNLIRNGENDTLGVSDLPGLIALSDKAITVTTDRLANFQPTPPDKLADLPVDPAGILRLTLLRPPGDDTAWAFSGTLDRNGALQTVTDPVVSRQLFDRTGVDAMSFGAGTLVRTRDSAAAETYVRESSANKFHRSIESPPGLPTARCFKYHGPSTREFAYNCFVSFKRYAAEVWSMQKQDAFQRISAQYAILANDK